MDITPKKRQIIIGRNHYGRVPMHELANILNKTFEQSRTINDEYKCKRCGSTKDVMMNGYCYDCEELLSNGK